MNVLEVRDIHTYYADSYVLQGVSLALPKGTVVTVLGRNGVGKTTLIRSICGFAIPRQGQIIFKGADVTAVPAYRRARLGFGLVPQGRRIFPSLTVKETLAVSSRGNGHEWTRERVIELFPRLGERLQHRCGKLSGGEQSMLATARALLGNPDVLLMDEPTEGLAPLIVRQLGEMILQLKQAGLSIILVEQNVNFALGLADYAYIMSKGKIVFEAPAPELETNSEVKTRYLGV